MNRTLVESKAIVSVGHDEATSTLELEFKSGRVYSYAEVPRSLYDWLLRVPDKGGFFNRMIRDRYVEAEVTEVVEQDLLQALRDSVGETETP